MSRVGATSRSPPHLGLSVVTYPPKSAHQHAGMLGNVTGGHGLWPPVFPGVDGVGRGPDGVGLGVVVGLAGLGGDVGFGFATARILLTRL